MVTALDQITFSLKPHQITGLVGANGSGKSTIIRLIAGLSTPSSGKILFSGCDYSQNLDQLKQRVGTFLGGDAVLYKRLTARENIAFFAALHNIDKQIANERIEEISSLLSMDDFLDRRANGFSRGMRQKVAFAESIIHNPDILLMDEPTTGMDIESVIKTEQFIQNEKEKGKTILLATHSADEMERLCDKLLILHQGHLVASGAPEELKSLTNTNSMLDMIKKIREISGNE